MKLLEVEHDSTTGAVQWKSVSILVYLILYNSYYLYYILSFELVHIIIRGIFHKLVLFNNWIDYFSLNPFLTKEIKNESLQLFEYFR